MKINKNYDLTGYVLGILTCEQAIEIEAALHQDPHLQRELQKAISFQHRVKEGLQNDLSAVSPTGSIAFAQISENLKNPGRNHRRTTWIKVAIHLGPAILGIALILFGLYQSAIIPKFVQTDAFGETMEMTFLLPILSTLFLLFSPMISLQKQRSLTESYQTSVILTFLLWFGQSLLWIVTAYFLQELVVKGVFLVTGDFDTAILSKVIAVFSLSLVWLTLIIMNGEFHYKHLGQPLSWRAFGRIYVISGIILTLSYLVL